MHPLIWTTALAVTLTAAAPEFKIETWHDRGVELQEYRTFDWLSAPPLGTTARRLRGELTIEDRLRDYVSRQLAARGYVEDGEGEVDFLVTYEFIPPTASRSSPQRLQACRCAGLRTTFNGFGPSKHENLLYLEFQDQETGLPVWRGRALGVVTRKEDPIERLALAVKRILERFPPETTQK